jgi:hypothetical protein
LLIAVENGSGCSPATNAEFIHFTFDLDENAWIRLLLRKASQNPGHSGGKDAELGPRANERKVQSNALPSLLRIQHRGSLVEPREIGKIEQCGHPAKALASAPSSSSSLP